ncbi:MAG: acetate/propionate family kinase [Chromatiaceae bacterium]|jgi:acetate kinase
MSDAIVVLNAGSSSIKFSVFAMQDGNLELLLRGQTEGLYTLARFLAKDGSGAVVAEHSWDAGQPPGHDGALQHLLEYLRAELSTYRPLAVGHRVVHGGPDAIGPVRVTAQVLDHLEGFIPLFPLHLPHNLAPVRLLLELAPELPQVASFDTSFHRSNPEISQLYALPPEYAEAGVRRYGFHGLSYEYVASVLPQFDQRAASGKTIVCHLGNGVSACAMQAGKSMASSMGFTGVEGLPMGTRSGALDPGVILYLMDQRGMDVRAIERLIYKESGLLGVSGLSSDMRTLLQSDDPRAQLAVDLFVYRIGRELGSLAAALGGLDALVFTAGIGEHAAEIRARVCRDAAWLGVELDEEANAANGPRISSATSRTSAWVIPTNEELMIARHTRRLIEQA